MLALGNAGSTGRERVRAAAREARTRGWVAPEGYNIVGYYQAARLALADEFQLMCAIESFPALRRAARRWAWRTAKALRDLGDDRIFEMVVEQGIEFRREVANMAPSATWNQVGEIRTPEEVERRCVELAWTIRCEAALIGEAGPFYKRATKLVGATDWMMAGVDGEVLLIVRTSSPGNAAPSRAPAGATVARARVGIGRDVRLGSDTSLVGRKREGEGEFSSESFEEGASRGRRDRAGERAGEREADGWE